MLSLPQRSCLSQGTPTGMSPPAPTPWSSQHVPFTVPALASGCWHPREGSLGWVQPQQTPPAHLCHTCAHTPCSPPCRCPRCPCRAPHYLCSTPDIAWSDISISRVTTLSPKGKHRQVTPKPEAEHSWDPGSSFQPQDDIGGAAAHGEGQQGYLRGGAKKCWSRRQ